MSNLPKFFSEDVVKIVSETITQYERNAGKTLQPAHIERLIINAFAYREFLFRKQANQAYRQGFPQFATGQTLDWHGEQVGAIRLSAKPALTTLQFAVDRTKYHGEIVIEAGAVASAGETLFKTLRKATIAVSESTVNVNAKCTVDGIAGNGLAVNTVNVTETASITPALPLSDLTVKNIVQTNSGTETESDEDYLVRILAAPEAFTTGTAGAYSYHARSVSPLITDVNIDNPHDENGEQIGGKINITILTKDGVPTDNLISQVQNYCSNEKRRDLCDTVIVKKPLLQTFAVTAELVLLNTASKADVLAKAGTALNTILEQNSRKLGKDIVPLDIAKALKVTGVYDIYLTEPATIISVPKNGWAKCVAVNITTAVETMES